MGTSRSDTKAGKSKSAAFHSYEVKQARLFSGIKKPARFSGGEKTIYPATRKNNG